MKILLQTTIPICDLPSEHLCIDPIPGPVLAAKPDLPIVNPTIVVDLDGTLTPTDTLVESVLDLVKKRPLLFFALFYWLLKGRAKFKAFVAAHSDISCASIPYNAQILDFLESQRRTGKTVVLATAAHFSIAKKVANHLGLFDHVIASDNATNLKGIAKLDAIRNIIGSNFVYAGDSKADLPIWNASKGAILVGVARNVSAHIRENVGIQHEVVRKPVSYLEWLRALRVHQWAKNLLIFIPLLTAFSFTDLDKLIIAVIAFGCFSLAASATYILNDLWDLQSDRVHPRKKNRPFASCRIPIVNGLLASAALITSALLSSWFISPSFFMVLLLYIVLTTSYSLALKKYILVDVLMLSLLYTLRIIAGGVAVEISVSSWLLAFSVFVFLSLALVKRCSELVSLKSQGKQAASGRDYSIDDLTILWPLGVGATLSAVVVFQMFINASETHLHYASPSALWVTAVLLCYWLARLWIKTARGEMHDDPLVYAIADRGSRISIMGIFVTLMFARFLSIKLL